MTIAGDRFFVTIGRKIAGTFDCQTVLVDTDYAKALTVVGALARLAPEVIVHVWCVDAAGCRRILVADRRGVWRASADLDDAAVRAGFTSRSAVVREQAEHAETIGGQG